MFLFRGVTCCRTLRTTSVGRCSRPFSHVTARDGPSSGGLLRQNWCQTLVFRRAFRLKKKPTVIESAPPTPNVSKLPHSGPSVGWGSLARPLAFTVAFSGLSFGLASIWQYENMRQYAKFRKTHIRQRAGELWQEWASNTPKAGAWRQELNQYWNALTEGQRVFAPICAANVAVFLMWRIPSLAPFMLKYFAANPAASNKGLPMILAAFSHQSPLHLFCNMFVLNSFCGPMVQALGKEQFVGLYFSSAVVTSFASHMAKVGFGRANGFSLGASGAICAILGTFGTLNPDAQLQIVFLPMLTFTASTALKGLIAIDTCGLVAGWQVFDHAAHLSGVLMGMWWVHSGHSLIWENRGTFMNFWHELRKEDP